MPHLPQLPAPTARRLVADYRQLQREPLSTCAATPDGDDLRRWRLSLTCSEGPHSGTIFHGDMSFPDNYPNDPPTIKLCTQLAHPNVFEGTDYNQHTYNQPGFFICLNMLRPPEDQDAEAYSGWSSAYTVHAILMQLSSFLFAENVPQDYGGSVRCQRDVHATRRDADAFNAEHGHLYPPLAKASALKDREPVFMPAQADHSMQLKPPFGGSLSIVSADTEGESASGGMLCVRARADPEPVQANFNSRGYRRPQRYTTAVGSAALRTGSVYFEAVLEQLPTAEDLSTKAILRIGVAEHIGAKASSSSAAAGDNSDSDDDYNWYMHGREDISSRLLGSRGSNSCAFDICGHTMVHDGETIAVTAAAAAADAAAAQPCVAWAEGDTLGVTLLRCNETGTVSLSFAHNGHDLGDACRFYSRQALTPAATLKAPDGQTIQARFNFGKQPFNFSPPSIQDEAAEKQTAEPVVSASASHQSASPLPRVASADERCRRSMLLRLGADAVIQPASPMQEGNSDDNDDAYDEADEQHQHQHQHQHQPQDPFDCLPDEAVLKVLKHLEPRDLAAASKTSQVLCATICRYNVWERREALCFHTKASLDEDILGLGFSVEHHARSSDIKGINAQLDLLSQSAYDSGVRRGVWQERFDRWIPLWLCDEHGERAWPRLLAAVHRCATGGKTCAVLSPSPSTSDETRRRARQYLEFFGKAMNAFVVSMMKTDDDADKKRRPMHGRDGAGGRRSRQGSSSKQTAALHASERALLGYCSFHHLLLAFCNRFPAMRKEANAMVARAIAGHTDKDQLPDLGVFLALLTVTDQSWSCPSLAWAVLGETLDRNVRWMLPDMPYLRRFERPGLSQQQVEQVCKPETLLDDWLRHTNTSRRVLMFQAYFLTAVGRPNGAHPSVVLGHYNCSLGRPTARMVESLRGACGEIAATSDWPVFFERLGLPLPAKAQVASRLCTAVANSRRKGYHHGASSGGRGGGGGGGGRMRGRQEGRR